jgi:hypothetical protein
MPWSRQDGCKGYRQTWIGSEIGEAKTVRVYAYGSPPSLNNWLLSDAYYSCNGAGVVFVTEVKRRVGR